MSWLALSDGVKSACTSGIYSKLVSLVESLSALPRFLPKVLRFPRFFAPGYSFWRRTRILRDPSSKIFFRRAVHVQSFQSPCTCTARPVLLLDFIPFDRANQELQNAFLDESLAQKEAKIWAFKVSKFLRIPRDFRTDYPLYGHTKNWNTQKSWKVSQLYIAITLVPFELETHLKKRFVDLD